MSKTLNDRQAPGYVLQAVHDKANGDRTYHHDQGRGDNAQAVPHGGKLPKRSVYPKDRERHGGNAHRDEQIGHEIDQSRRRDYKIIADNQSGDCSKRDEAKIDNERS